MMTDMIQDRDTVQISFIDGSCTDEVVVIGQDRVGIMVEWDDGMKSFYTHRSYTSIHVVASTGY